MLKTIARAALAVVALVAFAMPSQAQQNPAFAGAAVWARGGCANCHGNLAAGDGDAAYPQGPNLRRARLDRDALIETISCGRPGTQMPMNLKGAYTEIPCFGLAKGETPGEVPGLGAGSLTAEEIATLSDFLLKEVVGKTRITRDGCAVFFEGDRNAPLCQQFN
jgi:hypothetical protein